MANKIKANNNAEDSAYKKTKGINNPEKKESSKAFQRLFFSSSRKAATK